MMNDNRKQDSCIIPEKPANKPAPEAGAESVEGRRLVKGNELGNDKFRTLNEEKTRLIEFGRQGAQRRKQRGESKPQTFNFLGFTMVCP